MVRKKITGSGLKDLETADLKEGHTYYMGASSSPDLIYMEDVGPEKVTYRKRPYYPEDRLTRKRDIIEDLVTQGNETHMKNREKMMERYDDYAEKKTNFIDRDTNLKEIQRRRIKFKVKDKAAARMDNVPKRIEEKYRQKYGLETNMGFVDSHEYETTVNRDNLKEIRELPDIEVLESEKPRR